MKRIREKEHQRHKTKNTTREIKQKNKTVETIPASMKIYICAYDATRFEMLTLQNGFFFQCLLRNKAKIERILKLIKKKQ